MMSTYNLCDEKAEYVVSHPVFVFYVATNFTLEMLMGLDFGQNRAGIENVLMWHFEKIWAIVYLILVK